jgi:hypothetical protein
MMVARIFKITVFICVITGVGFLALAFSAEWFPRVLFSQYLPAATRFELNTTAEIRRVVATRNLRSLFFPAKYLKTYECRIRHGHEPVASTSFRFADGFRPTEFSITSPPPVDRGQQRVVFTFNGGNPIACDYQWGMYSRWSWVE